MAIEDITYVLMWSDSESSEEHPVPGAFRMAGDKGMSWLVVSDGEQDIAHVYCQDGMRPIFARRHEVVAQTGERRLRAVFYGWQQTVNGQNVKALTIHYADGRVVLSDRYEDS